LELRDNSDSPLDTYSTQDYLDLQVLFNLAWTDPDWLEQDPLATLVDKGSSFDESDKEIVLGEHLRLINEVIPIHQKLQDTGQIEVTMTPFAHPILPLLVDTDLARQALPDLELPSTRFSFGQDAVAQVERGIELYEEHFGRPPSGMWPAEGSVAEIIVSMVAQHGIKWLASDEGVLANSLGFDNFIRDSGEVVVEADQLYRPYYVESWRGGPVAIVFRDVVISDRVGFTYSGMEGELAAEDFIDRIHAIRDQLQESGAEGPHLVSVILDGENAWEHYENDGKEFLHSLYQNLSEDPSIVTVTPSEFLDLAPDQPQLEDLWAGSWISHDFSTWIGEEEENRAWELLAETREFLDPFITGEPPNIVSEDALQEALTQMYIAEGSDWFWWYGSDQNSGNDASFDEQFRGTLKQVYLALGEEPPVILDVPIIPDQAVDADQPATDLISPTIDGEISSGEWESAGIYFASGGAMATAQPYFNSLAYGFDAEKLYLKVNPLEAASGTGGEGAVEFYMKVPGSGDNNSFTRSGSLLGFPANRLVAANLVAGDIVEVALYSAAGDEIWILQDESGIDVASSDNLLELAVPLTLRAFFRQAIEAAGELSYVDGDLIPAEGPAVVAVPDLGTTIILIDIADPDRDDHGPGTYTYPLDSVFNPGNFDAQNFQVGFDDENVVFRFFLRGPIDNPWGSPNGLSLQTFDVYVDVDGDGQGGVAMLPGRNLALQEGFAWDYAISVEGWTSGVFTPGAEGPQRIAEPSELQVLADPGQRKVTIGVPKSILGDDPEKWHYAAAVMSQEGFPSSGVMRIRDVMPIAEQWRIGGAMPESMNHTRILDLIWSNPGDQEGWLGNFTPIDMLQSDLDVGDFAKVPMFGVE
jgi:alpha-amylase/alpha-mannosidase (GH57 family)